MDLLRWILDIVKRVLQELETIIREDVKDPLNMRFFKLMVAVGIASLIIVKLDYITKGKWKIKFITTKVNLLYFFIVVVAALFATMYVSYHLFVKTGI